MVVVSKTKRIKKSKEEYKMLRTAKRKQLTMEVLEQLGGEISFKKAHDILEEIRLEEHLGIEDFRKLLQYTMRELARAEG
jgi:hypothetical protein